MHVQASARGHEWNEVERGVVIEGSGGAKYWEVLREGVGVGGGGVKL